MLTCGSDTPSVGIPFARSDCVAVTVAAERSLLIYPLPPILVCALWMLALVASYSASILCVVSYCRCASTLVSNSIPSSACP
ncbi:hypothetical protein BD310DRAFT_911028 [Dichomitus squalens]|uniref:Uncharacterized protein n=1 Tax=Dichomitus squalens TaxID=114155 RepID=A0A4Q9QEM9_9APHY|nr:hypothetical protein BD310DRAFT_911028 [Dichomitus squalens]